MTKVSVLFNLRISGCELRDNYYVSFNQLLKKKNYRYIGISVILSPVAGFLSLVRVTQFSQFEKGIFVSFIISTSNGSLFRVFYDY